MKNMHKRSFTGLYESGAGDVFGVPVSIHFAEWWNGEGITFDINDQKHVALHADELHALMVIAIATKMVDVSNCMRDADDLVGESKKREEAIRSFAIFHNGYGPEDIS